MFGKLVLAAVLFGAASLADPRVDRPQVDAPEVDAPVVDSPDVEWKGRRVTLAAAGLADEPAIQALAPWAEAHGYALALSEDARLLVVVKGPTRNNALLGARVLAAHDELLAAHDELLGAREARNALVIAEIATDDDFQGLCDALAKALPTYASWFGGVRGSTGFLLPDPGLAAYLAKPKGIKPKEWHRENELVHRVAALDLYARFGRLPYWLEAGFAWRAELALCADVYCFPGRDGFVAVGEHRGWQSALARDAKPRLDRPFDYAELTGLARGAYDAELAPRAWGAVEYLARHRRDVLGAFLTELSNAREQGARKTHADGTWETVPNYEVPREKERELALRIVHPELCAELTRCFAQGSGFRPKPPR
ncbi:MAG: hypothetical protein HZA52_13480 [Planctomycetes bacterium]|nr:hypothetical protein [Planctomycetota bacterium]